jgi:hypothetical protein
VVVHFLLVAVLVRDVVEPRASPECICPSKSTRGRSAYARGSRHRRWAQADVSRSERLESMFLVPVLVVPAQFSESFVSGILLLARGGDGKRHLR